jgi:3-methylcrotonyl-CoA carboxylase alpha subunit
MPDSGKLIHLQLPPLSETVRVDAGFVAGDEVSAHYDPMIAKLIVRAPNRRAALQKLGAALEQYEIAGPSTNIEFLKRLCASPAFIAGEVETGYIDKHREELFKKAVVAPEVLAQTAIGLLLEERKAASALSPDALAPSELGGSFRARSWSLAELAPDGTAGPPTTVEVQEHALDRLTVRVGPSSFDVTLEPGAAPGSFAAYFPATRLETTLVRDEDRVTVWQLGRQHHFQLAAPAWMAKALGVKEAAHGVRAPMPCKVLRVDVQVGDAVAKGQVVATVESMKMEMTIRSPRDGVISRVVHQAGVSFSRLGDNERLLTNVSRICARLGHRLSSLRVVEAVSLSSDPVGFEDKTWIIEGRLLDHGASQRIDIPRRIEIEHFRSGASILCLSIDVFPYPVAVEGLTTKESILTVEAAGHNAM